MYGLGISKKDLAEALAQLETAGNGINLNALNGGGNVARFEAALGREFGAPYVLAVSSGTAALHTALMSADIGPGDEVIVSAYGWGQTAAAVLMVGATPVFADVDGCTGNINPESVADRLSPRTRAVLVTHLFGLPAEMAELQALCGSAGILLIADAAQAFGAAYHTDPIGAWGDMVCVSFGAGKALSVGEGGAVAFRDATHFERAVLMTQHPLRALNDLDDPLLRDSVSELGTSYRLSELVAAIGLVRLPTLPDRIAEARRQAAKTSAVLSSLELRLPTDSRHGMHAFHTYVAFADEGARGQVLAAISQLGLDGTPGPVRFPLHLRCGLVGLRQRWMTASWRMVPPHETWRRGSCPVAESMCACREIMINLAHADS